jgi:hypothetical protein
VSEKLVKRILKKHSHVKKFSFSRYVSSRCDSRIFDIIEENNIEVIVQNRSPGRPNLLEAIRL